MTKIALLCWSLLLFLFLTALAQQEDNTCDASTGECNQQQEQTPQRSPTVVKIAKGANEEGAPPVVSLSQCQDRYPQCTTYQAQGDCENTPGWMIVNCPHSCNTCHLLDPKKRCDRNFLNISTSPVFEGDGMEQMFKNIESEFGQKYQISYLLRDPYVISFDNFVNDEEIQAILDSVEDNWERSTDTGSENEFGEAGRVVSKSRTSANAWCRDKCETNPIVQNVLHKIEEITKVPKDHFESLQILRYEEGQFYHVHHDMGPEQSRLACGPRILTFFLYLSDVEEGGETSFPIIKVEAKPKKGSAILWPSTHLDDIFKQDYRTHHEAKAVIKGVKFAANAWIHSHNFEVPNLWGCTGAFEYI